MQTNTGLILTKNNDKCLWCGLSIKGKMWKVYMAEDGIQHFLHVNGQCNGHLRVEYEAKLAQQELDAIKIPSRRETLGKRVLYASRQTRAWAGRVGQIVRRYALAISTFSVLGLAAIFNFFAALPAIIIGGGVAGIALTLQIVVSRRRVT